MSSLANPDTAKPAPVGVREVLRGRDFRLLWLGQIISDFGSSLTNLALLVLVNMLTGSTAALALMGIVLALPQLTFGLLAGVYVDRLNRKYIMLASDLLRGFLVLGFILVGNKDSLWLLYVVAFIEATIGTFFTPARSAIIPNIVPEAGLLAANSLAQTSSVVAGVLGSAIAGVIIGISSSYWLIFTLDALTFFISFALISQIRVQPHGAAADTAAQASGSTFFAEFVAGMRVIGRSRLLLGTLLGAGVTMLGMGAVNILVIPLMLNDLHVPATWFGAIELFQTVGMVIGGALVATFASRFKTTGIFGAALVVMGAMLGLVAFIANVFEFVGLIFILGLALTPLQAAIATITQTAVGNEMRGRVGAALNTVITTASLVSMALAGVLGSALGIRNVFLLAGALAVIAGLAAAWVFSTAKSTPDQAATDGRPLPALGESGN